MASVIRQINKAADATRERLYSEKELKEYVDQNKVVSLDKVKQIREKRKVKISDMVSDNFNWMFSQSNPVEQPYKVLKGGRSSLKSSVISLKLVYDFMSDPLANVIAFRKVASYLSVSVYEQIRWAIEMFGVSHEFRFYKAPLKILHRKTGTAFYFFGVDDPQKLKSAKIPVGYVKALWYEELAEFASPEELDIIADTFIREDLPDGQNVDIYYSYNPPRNPYAWINEWVKDQEENPDCFVHHSDYTEDSKGFLSGQFLKRIERVKELDPDYYEWMYLGLVTGLGDTVYNFSLFKVINELHEIPDNDRLLYADVAIDTGYSHSATTFLFIGYTAKGRSVVLDTYYYSPINRIRKKAPSEFSEELWKFVQDNTAEWDLNVDTWTSDSADGAIRNQFYKDYGIALTPARKKQKHQMIENVEDLLVQERLYVLDTKNNKVFLDEHKKFQWEEDSLKTKRPKVIEVDDHTCDAFIYYACNNLSKLKLAM